MYAVQFAGLTIALATFGSTMALANTGPCPEPGKPARVPLENPSFLGSTGDVPANWVAKEHRVRDHYEFRADDNAPLSAPTSARIRQIKPEDFGVLDQTVRVLACWQGQRARLTGFLRTEAAVGVGAGLVMQTVGPDGSIQTWNHMNDSRVRGTQPWKKHQIEVAIPGNAERLRVGVMLEEGGTLWADDLSLEILTSVAK